jgi:uncharacterized protein YegP (UPF0339 family)
MMETSNFKETHVAAKFVIYLDRAKKFRFRLLASNGEVIATGEAYEKKDGCTKGIKSIITNAPKAEIVDETIEKKEAVKKPAAKKPAAKKTTAKKATVKKTPGRKPGRPKLK